MFNFIRSLASHFLTQASFLDPRFQSLQSADDVAVIKCALKKLNDIDPDTTDAMTVKKEKEHPMASALTKPKSGNAFCSTIVTHESH